MGVPITNGAYSALHGWEFVSLLGSGVADFDIAIDMSHVSRSITIRARHVHAHPALTRVYTGSRCSLMLGASLTSTMGRSMGTGPDRGIYPMTLTLDMLTMSTANGGALSPRLRNLESEPPDFLTPSAAPRGGAPA